MPPEPCLDAQPGTPTLSQPTVFMTSCDPGIVSHKQQELSDRAWVAGPLLTLDGVSQGQRRFPQNLPAQKSPSCPDPLTDPSSHPQRASQPPVTPHTKPPGCGSHERSGEVDRLGCPSPRERSPTQNTSNQQAARPQGM